jgi:hypothetical protein
MDPFWSLSRTDELWGVASVSGQLPVGEGARICEHLRGLKGHESIAQALAWVYISKETALKGPFSFRAGRDKKEEKVLVVVEKASPPRSVSELYRIM